MSEPFAKREALLDAAEGAAMLVQAGSCIFFASVQESKMTPGSFHLLVGRRSWTWPRSSQTLPFNEDHVPLGVVPRPSVKH